jgi:para-aminobenzoate synthetase / 4-amino-4-deoxychorismate lyase
MSRERYYSLPEKFYSLLENRSDAVLLETVRCDSENRLSYLFLKPSSLLIANNLDDIPTLFQRIEEAQRSGFYVAGWMAYECGYHFEPASLPSAPTLPAPLAWFGVYTAPLTFDHNTNAIKNHENISFPIGDRTNETKTYPKNLRFGISEEDYGKKISAIKNYFESGDTYQVNYTDAYHFSFAGNPLSLYREIKQKQHASYCAFMHCGDTHILSCSPELFFRRVGLSILLRPMKGTAPRGKYQSDDKKQIEFLAHDEKNRSENLMIVDLLRNDVGRISEAGSVAVREMFKVEKYETLFQMTSTITATLLPETSYYHLFKSLFPSGSVTGAPKIRTMQIISELETRPRGVYTGALGFFSPDQTSVFNVAIRTITVRQGTGTMGIGSGILFDSEPMNEYNECLLKARFLTMPSEEFQLIETILWENGYPLLRYHIARCSSSAEYFGFCFDEEKIIAELQRRAASFHSGIKHKVRLLVSGDGSFVIENSPIAETISTRRIALAEEQTDPTDRFYYHKTTRRVLYERYFSRAQLQHYEDFIFQNERGEITEGSISNIFIQQGNKLYTPPVECGLLPGVYRRHVLETHPAASEKILYVDDLRTADAIFICNAIRGMRRVDFAEK